MSSQEGIIAHHASMEATKLLQVDLVCGLLKTGDRSLGKEEPKHAYKGGQRPHQKVLKAAFKQQQADALMAKFENVCCQEQVHG